MLYEIGFKSGARIMTEVVDEVMFLEEIKRAIRTEGFAVNRIFLFEAGTVLVLSEVEYILPLAETGVIVKTPAV